MDGLQKMVAFRMLREEIGNKWRERVGVEDSPHLLKSSEVGNKNSCLRKRTAKR